MTPLRVLSGLPPSVGGGLRPPGGSAAAPRPSARTAPACSTAWNARVLVPHDGSPLSEAVLTHVRGLGSPAVTLLRVVEDGAEPQVRVGAELELGKVADRLRESGLDGVRSAIREGKPARAIIAAALELKMGLIAMTTHGRTGFDRFVLGSVAESVIRASPLPVLALRADLPPAPTPPADPPPPPADTFGRVLVPYDGSEHAWRAIETLALLGAAGRAPIELLGVVNAYGGAPGAGAAVPDDPVARAYLDARTEQLQAEVERGVSRARDLGFEATGAVEQGTPAVRILDHAEKTGATLIAMGTHGRSGITRWALGSVTESVLRVASVPLLIRR